MNVMIMIFNCMLSFSTMVTIVMEHCRRLGTKFKMANVYEKHKSGKF